MDQAYLKERLSYDPDTGVFTWNKCEKMPNKWNSRFAGKAAGCLTTLRKGYKLKLLRIDDKLYVASRVAWLYVTGSWPSEHIDHIDHDSTNNRFTNLREVSNAENQKNKAKRVNNTSGVTGVYWLKKVEKWMAQIQSGGRVIYGGYFAEFADAVARRKELEIEYGFHANHGV